MRKSKNEIPAGGPRGKKGTLQAAEQESPNASGEGAHQQKMQSAKGARDAAMTHGKKTGSQHPEEFVEPESDELLPGDLDDWEASDDKEEDEVF